MKTIFLERLEISHFKGIQSLTIDFKNPQTYICGANATGKTTIKDAFLWLLFGKDSKDKKDFSIKPLDNANNALRKTENEVVGIFSVCGEKVTLARINREKWTTKRGEPDPVFTGNETIFFYNDVPVSAGDYQKRISELLDEKIFKLITSPFAFNSLPWQERRLLITTMVGEVSDMDIIAGRPEFETLIEILTGKGLEDFRKEIAYKKKRLNDELIMIPARIDEVRRNQPSLPDMEQLQAEISELDKIILDCNVRISQCKEENEKIKATETERQKELLRISIDKQKLINEIYRQITSEQQELSLKRRDIEGAIFSHNLFLHANEVDLSKLVREKTEYEEKITGLRNEFKELSNVTNPLCPVCCSPYPEGNQKRLDQIQSEGKTYKERLEKITEASKNMLKSIREMEKQIEQKNQELSALPSLLVQYQIEEQATNRAINDKKYIQLCANEKEYQFNPAPLFSLDHLENELQGYIAKKQSLRLRQGNEQIIKQNNDRIEFLENEMRDFSQQIADLEKQEFLMASFERVKMEMVEDKINELFSQLKVKMFRTQINGGIEPCCEILIQGVPFVDANTAAQINAGIEIINLLCHYFQVTAPIFIDNRECVTTIIPTESQIINLLVSPDDKELKIF